MVSSAILSCGSCVRSSLVAMEAGKAAEAAEEAPSTEWAESCLVGWRREEKLA
jgi:hypothetical protein